MGKGDRRLLAASPPRSPPSSPVRARGGSRRHLRRDGSLPTPPPRPSPHREGKHPLPAPPRGTALWQTLLLTRCRRCCCWWCQRSGCSRRGTPMAPPRDTQAPLRSAPPPSRETHGAVNGTGRGGAGRRERVRRGLAGWLAGGQTGGRERTAAATSSASSPAASRSARLRVRSAAEPPDGEGRRGGRRGGRGTDTHPSHSSPTPFSPAPPPIGFAGSAPGELELPIGHSRCRAT